MPRLRTPAIVLFLGCGGLLPRAGGHSFPHYRTPCFLPSWEGELCLSLLSRWVLDQVQFLHFNDLILRFGKLQPATLMQPSGMPHERAPGRARSAQCIMRCRATDTVFKLCLSCSCTSVRTKDDDSGELSRPSKPGLLLTEKSSATTKNVIMYA